MTDPAGVPPPPSPKDRRKAEHDRRAKLWSWRLGHVDRRGAWSTGQLARHIGMSGQFVRGEIESGEIAASRFGSEWRIHINEVRRYLAAKGYPPPDALLT